MFNETQKITIKSNSFTYNSSHFHQHPEVLDYLNLALTKALDDLKEQKIGTSFKKTIDLKKNLGKTDCVMLNGGEEIYYAQRKGRNTLTKFVKGVEALDCSCITFVLSKITAQRYKIITAYVGYSAEKEPLDPGIKTEAEFNVCKEFWSNHALVHGSQKIYNHTVTADCPWDKFENRIQINLGKKNNIGEKVQQMREKSLNDESADSLKLKTKNS